MRMTAWNRSIVIIAGLGACAQASGADDAIRRLAIDRGCYTCHSESSDAPSANSALPPAPSWIEISRRYRGKEGAEDRLMKIVVTGSDPRDRHWKKQAAFAFMLPNDVEVTPEEARSIVRWILDRPK